MSNEIKKLIKETEELTYDDIPLMAGTISEGPAREFLGFTEIKNELPSIEDILIFLTCPCDIPAKPINSMNINKRLNTCTLLIRMRTNI